MTYVALAKKRSLKGIAAEDDTECHCEGTCSTCRRGDNEVSGKSPRKGKHTLKWQGESNHYTLARILPSFLSFAKKYAHHRVGFSCTSTATAEDE